DKAELRSTAGATHSAFASRPVLVQEHTLDLRGGNAFRSSALSLTLGSVGSYMPGAESREARGDGGFRVVGSRRMLTGTARLYAKDAGAGTSPLIASPGLPQFGESPMDRDRWRMNGQHDPGGGGRMMAGEATTSSQSVREYTLGTTA